MSALGGVCSQRGVPAPGGVVSQHALRQTPPPPWTDRRLQKHKIRNFVADGNYKILTETGQRCFSIDI